MTERSTLEQVRDLVDFNQNSDGTWCVAVVKGACGTVEGDCGTIRGHVFGTINGRQWQYVETPKEKMTRLIEEGASKEELLKALEEL